MTEAVGINLVSIPSMRWRGKTFLQSDTEVDRARVYQNFKAKVESLVFLACNASSEQLDGR